MPPTRADLRPHIRLVVAYLFLASAVTIVSSQLFANVTVPAIMQDVLDDVSGRVSLQTPMEERHDLYIAGLFDVRVYQSTGWVFVAGTLALGFEVAGRFLFGDEAAPAWVRDWNTDMHCIYNTKGRCVEYVLPRTQRGDLSIEFILAYAFRYRSESPEGWWIWPTWRRLSRSLASRITAWHMITFLPLLWILCFITFPSPALELRALTLLDANLTTLPEEAQASLPRIDEPTVTLDGLHVWSDVYRWGPPVRDMRDDHGRKFVVPWCRLVGWVAKEIATHPYLCHLDLSDDHLAKNAITARDYHRELDQSLLLSALPDAPHTNCLTAELLAFLDGSHSPRLQFRGLTHHLVMLHSIGLHQTTGCLTLRTHYVPQDKFATMDQWASLRGGECDYGDVLLEELYRDDWTSKPEATGTFPGALYHGKKFYTPSTIEAPAISERQHFSFSPVLRQQSLWQQDTVMDATRKYALVSGCRALHRDARYWLYEGVKSGELRVE